MSKYKLFLDDYRKPSDCVHYMHSRIGKDNPIYHNEDWVVVKNYPEFVQSIIFKGVPELISFDHDLAEGHYHKNMQEGRIDYESKDFEDSDYNKTGYHCAEWLIGHCMLTGEEIPTCYVHSMNPVGTQNIVALLRSVNR